MTADLVMIRPQLTWENVHTKGWLSYSVAYDVESLVIVNCGRLTVSPRWGGTPSLTLSILLHCLLALMGIIDVKILLNPFLTDVLVERASPE